MKLTKTGQKKFEHKMVFETKEKAPAWPGKAN
jgi:hypothetical protein